MDSLKTIKYLVARHILLRNSVDISCPLNEKPVFYLFFVASGTNMGDHALVLAEERFIRKTLGDDIQIVEIPTHNVEASIKRVGKVIRPQDIITFSAGGYIGDEYVEVYYPVKQILRKFSKNKILILPQTVYFHNKYLEKNFMNLLKKCSDLHFFSREEVSKRILDSYGVPNYIVPDIVLSESARLHIGGTDRVLSCLRNDVERSVPDEVRIRINNILKEYGDLVVTDTVNERRFPLEERAEVLDNMLREFSISKLVVTDRIHGMLFSYLTNTPCVVIGNYNHKVESEYEWIKNRTDIIFLRDFTPESIHQAVSSVLDEREKIEFSFNNAFLSLREELLVLYER